MTMDLREQIGEAKNLVFVGEAGSGKSEIAINAAVALAALAEKPLHFFDLDMTKPLFRSRDMEETMTAAGVTVHYQEQFMDAPTAVGGVRRALKDESCYAVLDVGGDHIGARAVGGLAAALRGPETAVFYVLNAYRPWSQDIEHIDQTLGGILGASHIELDTLRFVDNSNLGPLSNVEEVLHGQQSMAKMLSPHTTLSFGCAREEIYHELKKMASIPVLPLHIYLGFLI